MPTDKLTEIAPNMYEGMSPARKEIRRFALLPDGLTKEEMLQGLEGLLGLDSKNNPGDATAHLQHDLTEKNEVIDDKTYFRFIANAELSEMKEGLEKFNERVERFRSEQKQSERPSENRKLR